MNERIRELFKRAGGKTSVRNLASDPVQVVETHELWDDRIEKFAELIVRECINELEAHKKCDPYTGELIDSDWNDITQFQIINIKEHFGVEE